MQEYKIRNLLASLKKGLKKSRDNFQDKYDMIFTGALKDKDEILEKIEELLILSDIGPKTTEEILLRFKEIGVHQFRVKNFEYFKKELKEILINMLPDKKQNNFTDQNGLKIILVVGVNGTGKTSFVGKLAYYFKNEDKKVLLIPADTFRAGAINQLLLLSGKAGVESIKTTEGADSASVVYDGIQSAKSKKKGILIIDTAGRLHTYHNLMKELEKIKRVISKTAPNAFFKTIFCRYPGRIL